MKRYLLTAFCISALILAGAAILTDTSSADDDGYTVKGIVVGYDGTPLSGVQALISHGYSVYGDITDSSGMYTIAGLPANSDLLIQFSSTGKTVTAYGSAVMAPAANQFRLNLGEPPADNVYDLTTYPVTMMQTYITGYIMDMGSSENTPLAGAIIHLEDEMHHRYTSVVSSTGEFTIGTGTVYGLAMSIDEEGYTPVPGVSFMTTDLLGYIHFSLRGTIPSLGMEYRIPYTDEDGVRTYSIGIDYPILVSASTGDTVIYVTDNDSKPLQGCNVVLVSTTDSRIRYVGTTDQYGSTTFKGIGTGTYDVFVNVGGFENYELDDVNVHKGSNVLGTIKLTAMKNTDYFGMNMEHLMMVTGVIIGCLLVAFSWMLFSRRIRLNIDSEE